MYILDTNAIRYLVNPMFTTDEQRARLLERAAADELRIRYTPIANIELVSQLEEDPACFESVRGAVRVLLDLRADVLPDFEHRMWEIVADSAIPRSMYEFWHEMMECLANAPSLAALKAGYDDYKTGHRRQVHTKFLADFRANYEADYMRQWRRVLQQIVPDFDARVADGHHTRLERDEVAKLQQFLDGPEWHAIMLDIIAFRGKKPLPTKSYEIGTILRKIAFFQSGFEWLVRQSAKAGLRPDVERRKNDYNDIHLLLYVNEFTDDVLVSQDKEFAKKVTLPGGRLISYDEFVRREAT